jgi:hypothetical protein
MPSPLTLVVTPGYVFADDELLNATKLNLLANFTVALYGTIGTTSIGDNSISTNKLQDGAVTNDKLADGSVTTIKIRDANVTFAKLTDAGATPKAVPVLADKLLVFDSAAAWLPKESTIAQVAAAMQGASRFFSTEFPLIAAQIANRAHGLGGVPAFVRWVLVCQPGQTDAGYAAGDEMEIAMAYVDQTGASQFTGGANATNVFLACPNSGITNMGTFHKTTGVDTVMDASKWKAKCYASL